MRSNIAKSLQRRCQAIKNALRVYNTAAQALTPPRPTLDWSRVSHYTFLEEFNLLRNTRQDMQDKRWSELAVCETMKQYQRIKRAHEEIYRCNIEVRRLQTAVLDELALFKDMLPKLEENNPLIYGAAADFIARRRQVNERLLARIAQIHSLKEYTGDISPGIKKGSRNHMPPAANRTFSDPHIHEELDEELDDLAGDNGDVGSLTDDLGGLVDFISELTINR